MFALVIFLFAFASDKNAHRKIIKTEVVFENSDNLFINAETVNKLLIENKNDIKTFEKDGVDLNKLEKTIDKQPLIEKSQVFVTVDGVLKAVVKQRTPIARVFNGSSSYYIDYEETKMPLSDINSARVLIISGEINDKNLKNLSKVSKIIYNDDFLKKNIIGIEVLPNQSLVMKNRNFNYEIDFGKTVNCEKKFMNYKAFFQKAVLDSTLYKYRRINLKFTQQVVCIK
jgi:cell division protein FtsQ